MGRELRTAPGMRERAPGVWELIVEADRDPVTGKRRQVSRTFGGGLRDAKNARPALLAEVGKGRQPGPRRLSTSCSRVDRRAAPEGAVTEHHRRIRETYRHNVKATLGSKPLVKVTTKMLTDLYGEHQARGLACKWGWRDSNPAQWADPPSIPNIEPVVPTPDQVTALFEAAAASRRPEYARALFVSATTGVRRTELCALRHARDVDWDNSRLKVAWSIYVPRGGRPEEIPTKNGRSRVALDELTLSLLQAQLDMMGKRAAAGGVELLSDAYLSPTRRTAAFRGSRTR